MKSPHSDEVRVAYHEAGHATVARLLGIEIKSATIIASNGTLGHVTHDGLADYVRLASAPAALETQVAFERMAMMFLAGCMAERKYLGAPEASMDGYEGALEDLAGASALIESLVSDDEELLDSRLASLDLRVDELLGANWSLVERVAEALVEHKTLTGAQVDECMARAAAGSR